MDVPQPVTPELERDLANLVSLNRNFGSHRLVIKFLESWLTPGRSYRILDLATGAGDIPRLIADWCEKRGISVEIDAVDANESTLAIARGLSANYDRIHWIKGNALTYENGSYDLVCCSLALHHFGEEDAVSLLRQCNENSHRFVLVADLERSAFASIGIKLLTTLFYRDAMTRHDASLSAKRAFSWAELHTMAELAGWEEFGHARFLFCRQAIWLSKQHFGDIPLDPMPDVAPCPI